MNNPNNNVDFDTVLGGFDDEIDCAILDDDEIVASLVDDGMKASTAEEEEYIDDDECTDLDTDYSDEIHGPDIVDMDADDYIAAERDLIADPFEDDDIMDAVDIFDDDVDFDDDDED